MRSSQEKFKDRYRSTRVTEMGADYFKQKEFELEPYLKRAVQKFLGYVPKPKDLTFDLLKTLFLTYHKAHLLKLTRREINFNSNKPEYIEVVKNVLLWYLQDKRSKYPLERNIFLWGPKGTGKTTILFILAEISKIMEIRFGYERRFKFASMNDFYLKSLEESNLSGLKDFTRKSNLCFDELREDCFKYSHYGNNLNLGSLLLNARFSCWEQGQATIYTTNIPPIKKGADTESPFERELNDPRLWDRLEKHVTWVKVENYNFWKK